MRRFLASAVALFVATAPHHLVAQPFGWWQAPDGNWRYTFELTTSARWECPRFGFLGGATCAQDGTGIVLRNGGETFASGFRGRTQVLTATNFGGPFIVGQVDVARSAGFVFPTPTSLGEGIGTWELGFSSTRPIVTSTSLSFVSGALGQAGQLDLVRGVVGWGLRTPPPPPGVIYGLVFTNVVPRVLNATSGTDDIVGGIALVPESSTCALVDAGVLGIAMASRKRRRPA